MIDPQVLNLFPKEILINNWGKSLEELKKVFHEDYITKSKEKIKAYERIIENFEKESKRVEKEEGLSSAFRQNLSDSYLKSMEYYMRHKKVYDDAIKMLEKHNVFDLLYEEKISKVTLNEIYR